MTLQERLTALATAIGIDMRGKASSVHAHENATPGAAGFLSAEDKAKLDALSIPVGAVLPAGSSVGQVLKWNGTAWVAGTDETGGGGGGGTTYEFALAGLGGF